MGSHGRIVRAKMLSSCLWEDEIRLASTRYSAAHERGFAERSDSRSEKTRICSHAVSLSRSRQALLACCVQPHGTMQGYENRFDAGNVLARALKGLRGRPSNLILALPRGGVPVGYAIAQSLGAELDVIVVRKL